MNLSTARQLRASHARWAALARSGRARASQAAARAAGDRPALTAAHRAETAAIDLIVRYPQQEIAGVAEWWQATPRPATVGGRRQLVRVAPAGELQHRRTVVPVATVYRTYR